MGTMSKHQRLHLIRESGIIAIMRANRSDQLVAAAEAIWAGGVQAIEVTMTTPGALEVIAAATEASSRTLHRTGSTWPTVP